MKHFAVVFAAVMALSMATPLEVEERQMDIINMIINMLKGFICNGGFEVEVSWTIRYLDSFLDSC